MEPYMLHDAREKLATLGNRVTPTAALDVIKEDPDDNRILECAVAAKSDYIVTEDKDLLRLGQYGNARILTIRDCIQVLAPAKG
jgi:predicted nucleic acid-binding protein